MCRNFDTFMLIRRQKQIFRIICMAMLLLIHGDAYAYELAVFFSAEKDWEQMPCTVHDTGSTEADGEDIEWCDPVYKRVVPLQRTFIKCFLLMFSVFVFLRLPRIPFPRLCSRAVKGEAAGSQHLIYCSLLI